MEEKSRKDLSDISRYLTKLKDYQDLAQENPIDENISMYKKYFYSSDDNCPQSPDDPVTLYYFSVDGREYYIADFIYTQTGSYYTNYYNLNLE